MNHRLGLTIIFLPFASDPGVESLGLYDRSLECADANLGARESRLSKTKVLYLWER